MPASRTAGPIVLGDGVRFELADHTDADGVRLELDFDRRDPRTPREFGRTGAGWELWWPRPAVDRLEYQLTVRHDGDHRWMTDPGNPDTVPNPFGAKSEIRFPEYRVPGWLGSETVSMCSEPIELGADRLDAPIPVRLWSPDALPAERPAPLLLVHDGSDMVERGSLLTWATRNTGGGLPPFRVALLDPAPGRRDRWYAANDDYTDEVVQRVLPALADRFAVGPLVGLGASLGALAMLGLARSGVLAGAMLQSGSFFTPRIDPQESGFPFFDRVCAAVVAACRDAGPAIPIELTCGAVEENRANNEAMAGALRGQGFRVGLRITPDAHTMIGWRDAWSPGLAGLLRGAAEEVGPGGTHR